MKTRSLLFYLIRGIVFCVVVVVFVCVARMGIHSDLLIAAHDGDTKRVKYLLAWGVDVNGVTFDGKTALVEACNGNQISTASILLAHGADPNNALWHAIDIDNIEFVKLLTVSGAVVRSDMDKEARSHGNAAVYHVIHAEFLRQQKPGVIAHKAPPK